MGIEATLAHEIQRRWSEKGLPLRVRLWNGTEVDLAAEPRVTITLTRPQAARHLVRPSLAALASAYIEGELLVDGSIWEVLQVGERLAADTPTRASRWRPRFRSKEQDAAAVRYHYDVSNEFYGLWLDRQMVYSCAYFRSGTEDLNTAQEQKLDHICRKLMLQPGDRFLDIGCGWGALMCWAAKHYGVHATGVTVSQRQFEYATARVRTEGLEDRCRVLLVDYRDLPGDEQYDKIASVGMFEHVGLRNLPAYFGTVRRLLVEGGLMLNHGITAPESTLATKGLDGGDFIERYVFPLGELPPLSTAVQEMGRQDLEVVDVESLRPHYAQTLAHWVTRLEDRRNEAITMVGDRRYRIWRLYMAGCVHNFERGGVSIHQILGTRKARPGLAPLPWTREHLYVGLGSPEVAKLRVPSNVG